jgi:tRNA (guanine26-N2/guanine27-N2)-dimethyltransferase
MIKAKAAIKSVRMLSTAAERVVITEGQAKIEFPNKKDAVFYNKVQEFNRDLSILVIKTFNEVRKREALEKLKKMSEKGKAAAASTSSSSVLPTETSSSSAAAAASDQDHSGAASASAPILPGLRIFEALAASGLRSIRYFKELGGSENVASILVNDLDPVAVETIRANIIANGESTAHLIPSHGDANIVMLQNRDPEKLFHVIDLDPYGSAAPFLDATVQSVAEGGLLCITCTDSAILCGNNSETCYAKYRSMSLRGSFCHEMAIRIVLQAIEAHATVYKRHIVPVLSLSVDFYVRVFVRVYTSPLQTKASASKMAHVYSCVGCESFYTPRIGKITVAGPSIKYTQGTAPPIDRNCDNCGQIFKIGGPAWIDPMHDQSSRLS